MDKEIGQYIGLPGIVVPNFIFYAVNAFRTMVSMGKTKGMCGTPGEPVYPLNPVATYLDKREELQERISCFWSPPYNLS